MIIIPSIGCESRKNGGDDHDREEEEEEAKMGFIFQINEHGFGTQLHEEKGQKGGPNNIDYSLSFIHSSHSNIAYSIHIPSLACKLVAHNIICECCITCLSRETPCESLFWIWTRDDAFRKILYSDIDNQLMMT